MTLDLPKLKDEYGPCERLIVECYLHKEYCQDPNTISIQDCINCAYNKHSEKPFKPKVNKLEDGVNENDKNKF